MLKVGEIGLIRTTGEKVFILEVKENQYLVLRPNVTENGSITHVDEIYPISYIASVEEFANEQVSEMMLKLRIQRDVQKAEAKAQREIEEELFPEEAEPIGPVLVKKEPEIN